MSLSLFMGLGVGARASFAQAPAGWVGVELASGTHGGVLIHGVVPGSPAASTDLVAGDEVMTIDGVAARSTTDLRVAIGAKPIGKRMELEVRSADGKLRAVILAPAARPSDAQLARQRLIDKPAPEFLLSRVGTGAGKQGPPELGTARFRGHPFVIDFWATWCGPCVRALPELKALQKRYAARGLSLIGISTETPTVLRGAIDRLGIEHPILVDSQESVFRSYGVMALPTLVLIDGGGIVRAVEVGGDSAAIEAKLRELLVSERLR